MELYARTASRARRKKVTGGSLPSLPTRPPANQPKDYCGFPYAALQE